MLVRPITREEQIASAQLFAIAFESPFDPKNLTPFAENPAIWAAFDEKSGEMMSTVYVTDYTVQFDGSACKMGGVGGAASLPEYRRAGGIRACFQAALAAMYREGFAALLHLFSRLASDHRYVKFPLPVCTAMQYLFPEWSLGAVRWELQNAGMVRVVNAAEALRRARCLGSGSVTLRLHDAQLAENDGCFTVDFENGRAVRVERTERRPDAALEIGAFSALLSGVCRFGDAARYMPGVEVFQGSAPLGQIFFEKPLLIEDSF